LLIFGSLLIDLCRRLTMQNISLKPVEAYVAGATSYAEKNPIIVGASTIAALLTGYIVFRKPSMNRDVHDYDNQLTSGLKILNNADSTLKSGDVKDSINDYEGMFKDARNKVGKISDEESIQVRKDRYAKMVDHFYNLVTDFYEYGWGQSFHFGPRYINETFVESIKRAEYHLCSRLGLKPGVKVIDVGCGVGGPMRNMAMFSKATFKGITINEYQVKIGNTYCENLGLKDICELTQGDFQKLTEVFSSEVGTFDAAYAIEATCHSPDRDVTFTGIAQLLKPGGLFAGYEWVMLPKQYDPKNNDHIRIKEGIEVGNGLPTLVPAGDIIKNLENAGFEVLEHYDANDGLHNANELPWYDTLNGKMSLSGFRMTHIGRMCTHCMVWTLELLHIAPQGSTQVSALLNATAIDLVDGGKLKIFTPSYYFLARKK